MGGGRQQGPARRRRHRARGAAGRHRQHAAPGGLPVGVREAQGPQGRAARGRASPRPRHHGHLRPGRGAVDPGPRRVSLHGQRARRLPRVRRGADRPEGLLRAHRDGARLPAGPEVLRQVQVRDGHRLAVHAGRRSHATAVPGERGAEDPPLLRVPLRDGPRGRLHRHRQPARQPQPARRGHAARRRSDQQLPGARRYLQSRRAVDRRREPHDRRALRVRGGAQGPLRPQRRGPAQAAAHRQRRSARRRESARGGRAVPLRLRHRRRGPEGRGRHRSHQAARGAERGAEDSGRARRLRRAHVRVRGGGTQGPGHRGRGTTGSAGAGSNV